MFFNVCKTNFKDNVYHTLNELIFHVTLNFMTSWRVGFSRAEQEYLHLSQKMIKKVENCNKESILYMYKDLYYERYNYKDENNYCMLQYNRVVECVYNFTLTNFMDMSWIRIRQNKYLDVLNAHKRDEIVR